MQAGDEDGMRQLIEIHGDMLFRLVGRLMGWHADHEDVFQEVLVAIWSRSKTFRGDGSLEGWLKRLAVNRCRNHFRAVGAVKRLIQRFANIRLATVDHNETKDVANDETSDNLRAFIQKLSQADRNVLVLFYLEEMSGDEVAEVLDIKPATLHVRLHRARKNLKLQIESDNG
jgi:RNA polymerase sigma-70 factor (ECF subfamily)